MSLLLPLSLLLLLLPLQEKSLLLPPLLWTRIAKLMSGMLCAVSCSSPASVPILASSSASASKLPLPPLMARAVWQAAEVVPHVAATEPPAAAADAAAAVDAAAELEAAALECSRYSFAALRPCPSASYCVHQAQQVCLCGCCTMQLSEGACLCAPDEEQDWTLVKPPAGEFHDEMCVWRLSHGVTRLPAIQWPIHDQRHTRTVVGDQDCGCVWCAR